MTGGRIKCSEVYADFSLLMAPCPLSLLVSHYMDHHSSPNYQLCCQQSWPAGSLSIFTIFAAAAGIQDP